MADLGSSHLSSLLESVPGIASVLRSPVADALLRTIRAAAGLAEFSNDDATELIRYAVRRGLVGADEGDRVLAELAEARRAARRPAGKKGARPGARQKSKSAGAKRKPGSRGKTKQPNKGRRGRG